MNYFKLLFLYFIPFFIFNDLILAEDNYFNIKGIKFRIGKSHNQIQIANNIEDDEGRPSLELWSKYYTQVGQHGTDVNDDFKVWLGEKNTSWLFPLQLEFVEDVDEWVFSQYYFDFFQSNNLISTEKINAHENDYRNSYLLNYFLTEDEINLFCPSLKSVATKKIECILYSENDVAIVLLGKIWGIFLPLKNFRFFAFSVGLGLSHTDAKSRLYICKTNNVNYIKNGCDSLNLIDNAKFDNPLGLSIGLKFNLIKKINENGSWEFFTFTLLNNTKQIKYSNRSELKYTTEIVNTEIYSYIIYF